MRRKRYILIPLLLALALIAAACGEAPRETRITMPQQTAQTRELPPAPHPAEMEAPTPEPTPDPTPEPTPEPTSDPTPEPTPEPTSDPTLEPTPDAASEATAAPAPEPSPEPERALAAEPEAATGRDYVLNKNTKKFHYPTCSSVKDMKDSNRLDYNGTRDEIIGMGYSPCGRCKP